MEVKNVQIIVKRTKKSIHSFNLETYLFFTKSFHFKLTALNFVFVMCFKVLKINNRVLITFNCIILHNSL